MLKVLINISVILFLTVTFSFGRTQNDPKNLKQAVAQLNRDCPDSLKRKISKASESDLTELSMSFWDVSKLISRWLYDENKISKISDYLTSRGVKQHREEVILLAFRQFLLTRQINEKLILKPFQEIEKKWSDEDKIRFTADSLRGIYIPKDIEDCFREINSFWADSTKQEMRSLSEKDFNVGVHLGFGTWVRNNWQLWGGSRLTKYFNAAGIYHPEYMSGIIQTSYHRYLNGKEIRLDEQIRACKDAVEKNNLEEKNRISREFSAYHLSDTVDYKYKFGFVSNKQEQKFDDDTCIAKGVIIQLDSCYSRIKVRLIESCDRKGIIYHDNKYQLVLGKKIKTWQSPKKHIIKRMKKGQENWFRYEYWDAKT